METNCKSFSSKLCQGKILFECGMVTRWNLMSSKSGGDPPGADVTPYSQLRFIGRTRRREARGGAVWAAAADCQRAAPPTPAAPALRKPLRLNISISGNGSARHASRRIGTRHG